MELALTIISINLCYIGYVLNEILKTSNMKQKFEHPKVLSENGNELFFDEQGYLIREEPKQETLLGKTISKKDADKDSFEDVTNYKIERGYSEEDMLKSFMAGIKFEEDTLESFMTGIKRESNNEQNFEQFIKQINYENKK